jgi:uncharacterized protein (DUF488 family)
MGFVAWNVPLHQIMYGKKVIFSIGHSNRSFEEFAELLVENEIELLADIRTIPMSRANPQFNKDTFPDLLAPHNIEYVHLPKLGGRRGKSDKNSPNTFWEHSSFRNYADYAMTEPFREGLSELKELAIQKRTAYMCSEAVWWRCHRRIVTDYLLSQNWNVLHIMAPHKTTEAELNDHAELKSDGTIFYVADQQQLDLG